MQSCQFKFLLRYFIVINFAFLIANFKFCISYAGTLEDVRTKTGWQSPYHADRNSAYIPLVTPAELIANLDKYHRDKIRIHVFYKGITTRGLNKWIGQKNNKHKWSSKRYISFSIKDPKNQISSEDIYLFISKANPDIDKLFSLSKDVPIYITGTVRKITNGKAWIEVKRIELL